MTGQVFCELADAMVPAYEFCDWCGGTHPHKGHFSRLGGQWWCETCDSPYCELA